MRLLQPLEVTTPLAALVPVKSGDDARACWRNFRECLQSRTYKTLYTVPGTQRVPWQRGVYHTKCLSSQQF